MRKKFLLMTFLTLLFTAMGTNLLRAEGNVAKVDSTEYATIDEAIANWTNNTTLTLLDDVTLSNVIQLSSTEYHILDLGTYTMTAAYKKDAIQIVNNGRSSASYALDIKADATNPGGITASGKTIVVTTGRSGVKDRPIIRFYNGVFNGSNVVKHSGSNGTNCPQFQFHGGVFNGTINTNRSLNQFYGGTFNGQLMMSVDSSAYTLIAGGTFTNLSNLYGSALNSGKFTIGSAKGVYDKEVYIDDNGNYVIAATEPSQGIQADVAKTPGTNDYLYYSKVKTEGQLGYTDVYTAIDKNKSGTITVYVDELDLNNTGFTGTIVVPEGNDITITNVPENCEVEFSDGTVLTPDESGNVYTKIEVATLEELKNALAGTSNLPIIIKETIVIPEGAEEVLDLNGKTVKVVESTGNHIYALNNKGNLTIKDSKSNGSITARGIYNGYNGDTNQTVEGAKMTIESGKFVGMDTNGGAAIFNCAELIIEGGDFTGGVCSVNNRKMGVATIEGGEYHGAATSSYQIQNNGGQLTITNATVDSGFGAVGCYSGTTTIEDGTYSPTGRPNATCHVVYVAGGATVDIQGGTFKMNYPADGEPDSGSAVASYYNGTLTISGGIFTSHFDNVSPVELSTGSEISGGKYYTHSGEASNHAYIKNFLAPGVTLLENGEVVKLFDGEGTAASPYLIASVEKLVALRDEVNAGEAYDGVYFKLTSDITLTETWTPIGNGSRSSKTYTGNAFKGVFDGNNKTISVLTITSTTADDAAIGLFGVVDGGTVKNLTLDNVNINVPTSDLAGAAVGMMLNGATADNITVNGSVTAHDGVGGIVGRLIIDGTISNCTNNASVTSSYGGIGGIVGKAYYEDGANTLTFASVTKCTNNGTITAPMYVGGIVGLARANVTECINNGAVVGGTQTGGIIGQLIAAGTVSANENKAKISGTNHLGGIIGDYTQSTAYTYNNVSIANNINRGEVSATQCAAIMGCNNIDGFTAMTATGNLSYYWHEGLELFGNPEDMVIDNTNRFVTEFTVSTQTELQAVLDNCRPGTTILLNPAEYGVVYMRPNPANAATKEVDWQGNNYHYETYSCFENLTIKGVNNTRSAEAAVIDAIVIEGGTYYNTAHSQATQYPIMLSLIELKNVVIEDVTFTGEGGYDPQGYGNAINLSGNNIKANGLTVKNCVFNNADNNARLMYKTESTTTEHNYTYNGESFTFVPSLNDITVEGCTFNGGYMGLELRETENLVISGNTFNNVTSRDILLPTNTGCTYTDKVDIINNKSNGAGDRFLRASGIGNATLTVKGNEIVNYRGEDADFIKADGIAEGNTPVIEDNTLEGEDVAVVLNNGTVMVVLPVAQIGETKYGTLQAAIDAVQNGKTIELLSDVTENVTLTEATGLYYTIDGGGENMNGTITVNSLSDTNDNRRITIKNIKFVDTADANVDFISSVNTNHYPRLTVEDCTFTGSGNNGDVAIRLKSSHSVVIKDCTGTGLHSFLQNTSGWNLTINNVSVTNSKGGLALGTVQGVIVKDSNIDVNGYGIRLDAQYNNNAVIESNAVKAFIPVVVRNAEVVSNITFSGTNTMTASNTDGLWCAIGTSEYETNGTMPTAPTGKVTVTLNDTGLSMDGVYGNYYEFSGEGTAENPYLINNLYELKYFRDDVNKGDETTYNAPGVWVALGADIDMTGVNWTPSIGLATTSHGFMGNFDGKTYKIKNLTITDPALDSDGYAYAGLFGVTEGTETAQNTIKNLTIENVTISTTGHIVAAAIAYPYYTIVDNVKVCGNINITGGDYTSGVLAYTRRCVNASNLTIVGNQGSTITGNQVVGGVISDIQMNGGLTAVYNNFNAEGITITGTKSVGGISGIIAAQTLNRCSVKNVTLVCTDNRVGIVSGSLGAPSTISNATYENVTGATNIIGATYDDAKAIEAKIGDTYYASLQAALNAVVEGTSNGTVELISDIDLTDVNWTPVGTETKPFIGSFNGNEHTIKNLNIVETEAAEGKAYIGLFGYAKNTTIKNVVFENVNLHIACLDIDHSQGHIGAVAGSLEGTSTIENVTVNGDITVEATFDANGASRVAVVAGGNSYGNVTMKNVHVIANEGSYLKANNNVGALAGQLQGKSVFENCSSNIDVTGKKFFAGGIIGLAAGDQTFTNCHTTGNVTITAGREGRANDQYRVGGIAGGWADGETKVCTLTDCTYTGYVSGTNADGSVADPLDYAGYVGRGYTLANCAGSKVVIDGVEYVQVYDTIYGIYEVNGNIEINTAVALKTVVETPSAESVSVVLGDDITLTETIKINAGQTRTATDNVVTLDLNGRTITGTDNATGSFGLIEIQPGAELIINDSSDDKSGKITLTATNDRDWNAYSSVISNQRGKLTVNGGTIEHLGGTDMAYAIDNLTNGQGTYAETIINGGTMKSTYRAIRQFLNGTEAQNILTVNGGTIEGANKSIWMQDPSANANTGILTVGENAQLKGDVYLYVTAGSTEWPVTVSIASAALKDGAQVLTANVPAGYELKLEEGVYGVKHGVAKIGDVLYESLAEAATAAQNGKTIELLWQEGQAPIAMNASLYGKNVTIKGTATVDWSKGNLFVGRGGEGNATLTFDNANLTSASNSASYGIHVSGREKNTNNKYDGTLVINNSTIELDYLINKGTMTLDNSTLTVKNGFAVGGRPASETESGEDATATITLSNNSKVVVNNHNGMGLGYEAIGVMDIDATSTFETTQAFLVTANGTMNNAGTVNITGTLTNNGAINFTGLDAKLTAQEGLTIVDLVNDPDYKVVYKEGAYQFVEKVYVAQVDNGDKFETLIEAVNNVVDGGTITLIANETFTENNRYNNSGWWDGLGYSGDKSFTIDLANYTISQDGALNDYLMWFKNDGAKDNTITLKNGTLDAGTTAYCALATSSSNTNKITINTENINFIGNNSNGAVLKIRGGAELNVKAGTEITGIDSYVGIECYGATVNIYDGAEIYQNGTSSYNGCLVGVSGNGTVNVYGGYGKGVSGGFIAMTSGGTINVEGGEWIANNDGTYANSNKSVLVAQSDKQYNAGAGNSIVNVTGGTFKGGYNCYGNAPGDAQINISGGNFNADPSTYVVANYKAVPKADGTYDVIQIAGTQTREFAYPGWYWFSTYIDFESGEEGLDELQEQLGDNAATIKGQKAFTNYQYYNGVPFWTSALTSISASEMYMIKTTNEFDEEEQTYENVRVSLEGNFVDYENYEITIHNGWNWIGYPLNTEVSMTEALARFTPAEGDMIKGKTQNSSSSYNSTLGGWWPDFNMIPGEGYMYYSAASVNKTLTYSAGNRGTQNAKTSVEDNHWIVDEYKYSNNMTVIAMLSIDGEIVKGNYEVAAFANGECRGSARPIYIEAIDAYVLFMTIHGDEVEELTFMYYDIDKDTEYELSNVMNYSNDAIVGTIDNPYIFSMNILGIDENSIDNINIYPNPTTTDREINLQATCDKVEVFNALGVKVAEYHNVDTLDALETAGIYVIRITNDNAVKHCRLVVK